MMTKNWTMAAARVAVFAISAHAQNQRGVHNHAAHDHSSTNQTAQQEALPSQVAGDGEHLFACPMHAEILKSRPGNCPICRMPLAQTAGAPSGAQRQNVGPIQVDTFVEPGGLRVRAYHRDGRPIELMNARGLATLQVEGAAKRYRYDLFPDIDNKEKSATSLAVAVDLSQIAGRNIELRIQLANIPGNERNPLVFDVSTVAPMSEAQKVAAAIETQKVCPVSGHSLGSMGAPIAVSLGDETVYVCCKGCIDKVKADPKKYLPQKQMKLAVAPSTDADADAIKLQKLCPVMDEPLGEMGIPLKVTGLERDVFLCCKGCLKFLEKEQEKYLAKLSPLPESERPIAAKATKADARFVAAQRLCPVMDEQLDAMGGPYKTVIEEKVVYVCCPGCVKKLQANPAAYLEKLTRQGVTPPTAK